MSMLAGSKARMPAESGNPIGHGAELSRPRSGPGYVEPRVSIYFQEIGLSIEGGRFLHGLDGSLFEQKVFRAVARAGGGQDVAPDQFDAFKVVLRRYLQVAEPDLQLPVERSRGGGFTWHSLSRAAPAVIKVSEGTAIADLIDRVLSGDFGVGSRELPARQGTAREHRIRGFLMSTGLTAADLRQLYRVHPDAFVKSVFRALGEYRQSISPEMDTRHELEFEQSVARVLDVPPPTINDIVDRRRNDGDGPGAAGIGYDPVRRGNPYRHSAK